MGNPILICCDVTETDYEFKRPTTSSRDLLRVQETYYEFKRPTTSSRDRLRVQETDYEFKRPTTNCKDNVCCVPGRYVGSRPIKLRKSTWRARNIDTVRKKEKEKTALIGLLTGR
uniref:Uncharacterized protein n=1 Tax=Timema tahoe TaxID=61484 RepID=A0A7R9ICC6_9NEOP|nr:unnamed protein product [Timema tahoe]